jgi:hypothetical protein
LMRVVWTKLSRSLRRSCKNRLWDDPCLL